MGHPGTMLWAIIPLLMPLASCAVDNSTCSTVGGSSYPDQTECVFPFKYKEQEYHGCTNLQETAGPETWCATQVDNNREMLERSWGICSASCQSAKQSVTVYSASATSSFKPKEQSRGELASRDETGAQYGVYVTSNKNQAEDWADRQGYKYICEATLNLDRYMELDSMVFAPQGQEDSDFQKNSMLMHSYRHDNDDELYYKWTVTVQDYFETFVDDNLSGFCGNVLARDNLKDKEILVYPLDVDTLEASIMHKGTGHQIFIKDNRGVFKTLLTGIKCNAYP